MYVALSDGTILISVMSQQYNCLLELYTKFLLNFTFHENVHVSSFFFYTKNLRYVKAEMNVHAFTCMNELDQKGYW